MFIPTLYTTRSGCSVEDFGPVPSGGSDSARNIIRLLVKEYNELYINLYIGSYYSAVRCLRASFEWLIKCVAIVSDASIITNYPSDKNRAFVLHL